MSIPSYQALHQRTVEFVEVEYYMDRRALKKCERENRLPRERIALKTSDAMLEKINELGILIGKTHDFSEKNNNFSIVLEPSCVIYSRSLCCCYMRSKKPVGYKAIGEVLEENQTINKRLKGEELSAIANNYFLQFRYPDVMDYKVELKYRFSKTDNDL